MTLEEFKEKYKPQIDFDLIFPKDTETGAEFSLDGVDGHEAIEINLYTETNDDGMQYYEDFSVNNFEDLIAFFNSSFPESGMEPKELKEHLYELITEQFNEATADIEWEPEPDYPDYEPDDSYTDADFDQAARDYEDRLSEQADRRYR